MEKIRRDNPEWGVVLTHPTNQQIDIERANADLMVESLDAQTMTLWKWEPFYRGMWVFMTLLLCVSAALIGGLPWVTYSEMLAKGRDADLAMLLAWIDTAMIGAPLVGLIGLLLVPRAVNTIICRRTRKVLGSSGLTGLGGWVELDFNNLTAVSVIERRYHQAGRTTTYSLWLCELDGSDRITKRIVAMQPTRHPDAPRQTWEFIRAYMHLPPDRVPPVKLGFRGTRWADRVHSVNLRLFGALIDDATHQLNGAFNRAFAALLGAFMYPWEITGWVLDKVLRERTPPESLPHVPVQTASQHNPYRMRESDRSEEEKIQAVARTDGWVHVVGVALSVLFYAWVIFLWSGSTLK
ncbi:hypothetical protein [Piscinibacter gummiphilus]|uniref:Uncharacterized protein n=1 Tax=Piscinibacter gummiphilus TaxID=946333 RepID=A0ABZ0CPX1_9BURK|nr:hypothetical protein [Piscinibacter gummiphilus]WOB07027.1 hypothetical protein RXV79_19145 [Piscinibacter gummiphilus]